MSNSPRRAVWLLICSLTVAGACSGDDDPTIDDSNVTSSSRAATALSPCETVRGDLEQLRETLGVPDGLEELKEMLADGLDQVETAVGDAGALTGEAARRVQGSLRQAATNAESAVAAIADGDFGLARDEFSQVNDDVARAWDLLTETCPSS